MIPRSCALLNCSYSTVRSIAGIVIRQSNPFPAWFPSASCGQKPCCGKRITATAGSRDAHLLSRARLRFGKLASGAAGGGEIGQAHLGVFAREDQAISAGFERGGGGGVGVV